MSCHANTQSHSNVNSEFEAIIRQTERDLTSMLVNDYESLRIKTSGDFHCTTDTIEDLVSDAPPQVVHAHSTVYISTMSNLTNYKQQRQASSKKKMVRDTRLHQQQPTPSSSSTTSTTHLTQHKTEHVPPQHHIPH